MAKTGATLLSEVRRKLKLYKSSERTLLNGQLSASAVTAIVDDGSIFNAGDYIEIDGSVSSGLPEVCYVSSISSNTLTIVRAELNSTAQIHADNSIVWRAPRFYAVDIWEQINVFIRSNSFPWFYTKQYDKTTALIHDTYEYGIPFGFEEVAEILVLDTDGKTLSEPIRDWDLIEGNKIRLRFNPENYTYAYMKGVGKFTELTTLASTIDLPDKASHLPVLYAVSQLLIADIGPRADFDRLPTKIEGRATEVRYYSDPGQKMYQLFLAEREALRMPPWIRWVKRRRTKFNV